MEKNLNTRIQFKNDSEENWSKAQDFIPMKGEMIIYNADDNFSKSRIKIGNGNNSLSDLTFINNQPISNNYIDALLSGYLNYVLISTEANSKLIYNKEDCYAKNF